MPNQRTIGLTGGIASGKSTVASILARQGAGVVDADAIAREVVLPGSDGLREITAMFGSSVLEPDGSLSREKLASIVFASPDARKKLEAITHPRIAQRSAQRIAELHASGVQYVLYDASLLVEVGAHRGLDALIVVAVAEPTQVARAVKRGGLGEAEAQKRVAAQLPLARKLEVADYVIHNDGTLEDLERQTLDVHRAILQRFGLEQARTDDA
jgi:dephospho-CoA kinase